MGYGIHDLFEEKFTHDKIESYLESGTGKEDIVSILVNTLWRCSRTFENTIHLDHFIMRVLEDLFSLEKVTGTYNRFKYAFNIIDPYSTLIGITYGSFIAEVICDYNSVETDHKLLWRSTFKKSKSFNVKGFLNVLELKGGPESRFSSLDILLDYLKILKNRDILREIVSGLLAFKFDDDGETSDTSLHLSTLFGMITYDEPLELLSVKYKCRGCNVVMAFRKENI